jgi:hypothetical protein
MKEITVSSWEECQAKFKDLEQHRRGLIKDDITIISGILYRGQANSKWRLETTLERAVRNDRLYVEDYYKLILSVRPEIESFTEKVWEVASLPEYHNWLESADFLLLINFPSAEYMVYLRNHDFPSPLLDWTKSAHIATYFAFRNVADEVKEVSIYAYIEYAGCGKTHWGKQPEISTIGPNIRTHQRHFRQQCQYTFCAVKDETGIYYSCHENVFSLNEKEQDLLWKINIPASERIKVLAHLDSLNINAFSLFGSEESLMETLALRRFHLTV